MLIELIVVPIISAGLTGGVIYYLINKNKKSHIEKDEVKDSSIEDSQTHVDYNDKDIRDSKNKASHIINDAKSQANRIKRNAERNISETRNNLREKENKLRAKQENLDRLKINLEKEKSNIEKTKDNYEKKEKELDKIKKDHLEKLEKIASLTKSEAKKVLLANFEKTIDLEYAKKIKEKEESIQLVADQKAKEILIDAMHNAATDYVAEFTLSKIKLKEPDIKGKIIGKDGRNIKAFEDRTGVNIDFEDNDEVRLSSFDSVRREIAKVSLEKLIKDGRIHPSRIEEVVDKTKVQVEKLILKAGEELCTKIGVYNLPKEIVTKLGNFKYRTSYGQNMIQHTLEETQIGVKIAKEVGADVVTTKLACLLHDIGKVITDKEGNHIELGAEFLKNHNLPASVVTAVAEHHDDKPSTIPGIIVQIADSISGSRPGARYEDFENYIKRITAIEEIAKSFKGVNKAYAISAGRELRVIVNPDEINDVSSVKLSHDIAQKIKKEQTFPGTVKVAVIRETRSISTAT